MPQASYSIDTSSEPAEAEPATRKPDNTAFKQQRLPAWQPILTPTSVLPTFFIIAIIFIPVGAVLLTTSNNIIEVYHDYTECYSTQNQSVKCSEIRNVPSRMNENCTCNVNLNITRPINGDVYVYYGLTNFYQNHRRYVKSRDDIQLFGEVEAVSTECSPYDYDMVNNVSTPIAPCGAIANSLFNDTFTIVSGSSQLSIDRTGIAWNTDHQDKFNNPPPQDNLTEAFKSYTKPLFWQKSVIQLDPENNNNNGYKNEAFEVWMRTAAFPKFRKLYGRLSGNLARGNYMITVDYNYPVTGFGGTKKIILSNTSWMGGKNSFLGIAYIVVGACSFLVGVILCIIHFATKHKSRTE